MSDFVTYIPVDVVAVTKLLPANSDLLSIEWVPTANCVELKWGNEKLVTPYSIAVDYPVELLKSGKLPEKTVNRGEIPVSAPAPVKKVGKKAK